MIEHSSSVYMCVCVCVQFCACYLSFQKGGCHGCGKVCLLYPGHLLPFSIWKIASCPFFTIWEVLLANAL